MNCQACDVKIRAQFLTIYFDSEVASERAHKVISWGLMRLVLKLYTTLPWRSQKCED